MTRHTAYRDGNYPLPTCLDKCQIFLVSTNCQFFGDVLKVTRPYTSTELPALSIQETRMRNWFPNMKCLDVQTTFSTTTVSNIQGPTRRNYISGQPTRPSKLSRVFMKSSLTPCIFLVSFSRALGTRSG